MIDDGRGVHCSLLMVGPWAMDVFVRDIYQFWYPPSNIATMGVAFHALDYRVEYPKVRGAEIGSARNPLPVT
tara:strand:+ start:601 stop:816 length:216 start_codon:yes stop_codon:yes gene_type:complete